MGETMGHSKPETDFTATPNFGWDPVSDPDIDERIQTPEYKADRARREALRPAHLSVQELREENDRLLSETINLSNGEEAGRRIKRFNELWPKEDRFQRFGNKRSDSPFSKYSSKGWKIHVSFDKGREREMAAFLFTKGLYFKVESLHGTSFDGNNESGATIYIGAHETMKKIVDYIQLQAGAILRPSIGNGMDIAPKIRARFDVQKTPFGTLNGGSGKYSEYGLDWPALGGIPILSKFQPRIDSLVKTWGQNSDEQKKRDYQEIQRMYEESKQEAIKDFGEEFLLGRSTT